MKSQDSQKKGENLSGTAVDKDLSQRRHTLVNKSSGYLNDQPHTVWKPEHRVSINKADLEKRREQLMNRVWATQLILSEENEAGKTQRSHSTPTTRKLPAEKATAGKGIAAGDIPVASSLPIHQKVSQYLRSEGSSDDESSPNWAKSKAHFGSWQWRSQHFDGSPRQSGQGLYGSPKPSPLLIQEVEPILEENEEISKLQKKTY